MSSFSERYDWLKNKSEKCDNITSLEEIDELIHEAKLMKEEYHNLQLVVKSDANSIYGVSASIYFSLCDFDCAEDIPVTGRHYAILCDVAINKYFMDWSNDKNLKIIQDFYPEVKSLRNFTEYIKNTEKDICVYGDTDSRYCDIDIIYSLLLDENGKRLVIDPDNEKLANFVCYLMKNFIDKVINDVIVDDCLLRNANPSFLRMAHEVTTRRCVFQAMKKYVMVLIWKDGKMYKVPQLKTVGVELKKGELNPRIKKMIYVLVNKHMLDGFTSDQLRVECLKLIKYMKIKKEKSFIYRITSVNGLKSITLNEKLDVYETKKNHIGKKIALSWYNFIHENKLTDMYKPPFEGQKMNWYYTVKGTVMGVPDDVDINSLTTLPEVDWNKMLNQILLKPLLKYILEKKEVTEADMDNFLLGVKQIKIN